jgi:sigma-B regulation protein RsbU (phosphoserine phosphatase)
VPAGSRLYLFSDGVYEVRKTDGNEMVLDDFIELVADPQPAGAANIDGVRKAVASLQGRDTFDDDFSLMELIFA